MGELSKKRSSGQTGAAMVEYIPMVALFILLTVTALTVVGQAITDNFFLVGEGLIGECAAPTGPEATSPNFCMVQNGAAL